MSQIVHRRPWVESSVYCDCVRGSLLEIALTFLESFLRADLAVCLDELSLFFDCGRTLAGSLACELAIDLAFCFEFGADILHKERTRQITVTSFYFKDILGIC